MKRKLSQIDNRKPIQLKNRKPIQLKNRKPIIPQVIHPQMVLARETEIVGVRTEIERTPNGNGYIETRGLLMTVREKSKRGAGKKG